MEASQECTYRIEALPGRGNSLVAARAIQRGENIVTEELPFVWHPVGVPPHAHCAHCGCVLRDVLLGEIQQRAERAGCEGEKVLSAIQALLPPPPTEQAPQHLVCGRAGCADKYCSTACQTLAQGTMGHDWICAGFAPEAFNALESLDSRGHIGTAMKVYARIAAQCQRDLLQDNSLDLTQHALNVANSLLTEFHFEDFCLTMHAFRTGRLQADENMFENMLFPAYFQGHLATPLALIKELLLRSGSVLWSGSDGPTDEGRRRAQAFLSSQIFSDKYFARIMGTFAVNSLSVHVPSPLDHALSAAQARLASLPASTAAEETTSLQEVVRFLQAFQQERFEASERAHDEDEDEEEAQPRGNSGHFPGMSATGLFSIFSKTNHSCLSNTSMHGSHRVSVTIRATEKISAGEEITNCYIHHPALNHTASYPNHGETDSSAATAAAGRYTNELHRLNARMTKKQRYRALRQYVFECRCPLCEEQVVDSDEDSD